MKRVIDVSTWQGAIDWKKVHAAGYDAILRIGYGNGGLSLDDQFARNLAGCDDNRIYRGIYFYAYDKNVDAARKSAHAVCKELKKWAIPIQYPVYYDIEEPALAPIAQDLATAFCEVVESYGYFAGIYASASYWRENMPRLTRYTKWIAAWNAGETKPSADCAMWQYTNSGSVPGIRGAVDLNRSYIDWPLIYKSQNNEPTQIKNITDLVDATMRGDFGVGEQRRATLGDNYDLVQATINYRAGIANALIPVVEDVEHGRYGNGDERKKRLGEIYEPVQKMVNARARVKH